MYEHAEQGYTNEISTPIQIITFYYEYIQSAIVSVAIEEKKLKYYSRVLWIVK